MATKGENSRAANMYSPGSKRSRRAAVREFSPNRSVILVSADKLTAIPANEVSPQQVGWKGFGLSCLPPEWVPRFFVVDFSGVDSSQCQDFEARIADCALKLDLGDSNVLVRSSGVEETIEQRGQLFSETCSPIDIIGTIRNLSEKVAERGVKKVYWIVQEYIPPVRKGHLSNERRLSYEARDFVAEFEIQGERPGYTVPVAVRHWRDGDDVTNFDLSCTSEAGVTLRLKSVALWATALSSRILFEWVWSGSRAWIVQADLARPAGGVNPNMLRPKEIPQISSASLRVFRVAGPEESGKYRKLRNARTYSELGYEMPTFYIVDDPTIIQKILVGEISDSLERDLEELTRRPLMIRTDGIGIPPEQTEMLPRSEDLHTSMQARKWLIERFSEGIKRIGIASFPVCLIAHHFIPSIAAAWARSEPGNNTVRIESLWGLPEGLYWYSHDTFEVDAEKTYPTRKRLRFKGTFVAPDDEGNWVHYRTSAPFDWGRSISQQDWLFEISEITTRVANSEGRAVSMMWFVDNDPRATPHRVLPWYHIESAIGTPKAAPRRKITTASDFKIETSAQWEELKLQVKDGKRIERIMLEPKDMELVRNQDFARELGGFAAANNIVIELAGGVLSHAYHILQLRGARVQCVDLFGADEENVEYNKLVRDKIPSLIEGRGEGVEVVRLKGEALLTALRRKLVEESYEALDARPGDELIGELADVQEVIEGIRDSLQVPAEQLDAEREEKRKRRGGFRRGVMLKKTSSPHTLASKQAESGSPSLPADGLPTVALIEHASQIPASRPYSRPDVRSLGNQPEALLTFETELSGIGTARQSAVFEIPLGEGEQREFKVSVEFTRDRSTLWSQVRLRLEPLQVTMNLNSDSQMELKFPKEPGSSAE